MAVVAGWMGALGVLAAVVTPGAVAAPGAAGSPGAVAAAAGAAAAAAGAAAPGAAGEPRAAAVPGTGRPRAAAVPGAGRPRVGFGPGTGGPGAGRPRVGFGPRAGGSGAAVGYSVDVVGWGVGGGGFAVVGEVDASIGQEMRYATSRNFTGAVVDGYDEPVCLLARSAAEALRRAQREVLRRGYSLLVYDCYRPQRAVDRFVRWARDGADQRTKAEFYPEVAKDRLIPEGYIAERSGHSRGSTVDVTLAKLGRGPLDMGTPFDFFDPLAHTDSPRVTGAVRENRDLLRRVLGRQGFVNLPQEWWHFTHAPEAFPDTHFDFPVSVASVHR